jgi:hypothetical protein
MRRRRPRGDWLNEDEYPDDRDIAAFGDYSASDDDPLTIGRVGHWSTPFWTRSRIVVAIFASLLLLSIVVAEIMWLLNR